MSRPYKCPVCDGRGEVKRSGVREDMRWEGPYKACRACDGKGVLWSCEPDPAPPDPPVVEARIEYEVHGS